MKTVPPAAMIREASGQAGQACVGLDRPFERPHS